MSETVNQETNTAQEPEKTFTQAEMNAIIGERLSREREKYSDYEALKTKAQAFDEAEEANKSELQKATEKVESLQAELDNIRKSNEERALRERVSKETGVPVELLRGNSEDDLRSHAEAIMGFAKTSVYPNVKDGGETVKPPLSRQDILSIKDERKRLEAIKQNIELF